MQVNDIGLLVFRCGKDIYSVRCQVILPCLPERFPKQAHEAQAFQRLGDGVPVGCHVDIVCLFVAHQHLGLDAVFVQCRQQASGCYGATSGTLCSGYYQDLHCQLYSFLPIHFFTLFLMACPMYEKLP